MFMFKNIIETFHNLDKEILTFMKKGFCFCFFFGLISMLVLIAYHYYPFPMFYIVGTLLFKFALTIFSSFIILGIGFDKIKKQIA